MTEPLSDQEIENLRTLLLYAEQLQKQATYRAAVRVLLDTWRGSLIFYGGLIAAFVTFKDQIAHGLKALLGIQ